MFNVPSFFGFRPVPAVPPSALLIDLVPGANLAFSLRKLRTLYSGYAIKVQRDVDDALLDIPFVDNVVDVATIASFCGSSVGYLHTMYGQGVTSINASQTDKTKQAKIYDGTSVVTENSKAAFDFYSKFLNYDLSSRVTSTLFTSIWVCKRYETNNTGSIILGLTSNGAFYAGDNVDWGGVPFMNASGFVVSTLIGNSTAGGAGVENVQHVSYMNKKSTTEAVGQYNNSNNSYNTPGATLGDFDFNTIAGYFGSDYGFYGKFQELVCWPTDEKANKDIIHENINDYYSIY